MQQRLLVLGSTSTPRYALLQRLQIPFKVAAPNIDETPLPNETPQNLVQRLALEKAQAVAKQYPDALIIGADQVGVLDGVIQGKPLTYENAKIQLQNASGKTIKFYIGLCLYDSKKHEHQIAMEEFDVIYRILNMNMIEGYLKKEQPLQCAGSCKAEGLGIALIKEFRGTDFSALIGLPLIRLVEMLEQAGISLFS
ncbi:MAG TPA: nucleoside triphosphate pyrophosphatase [Gammaproteobacteria bacterium]|nr:nucleoside triphosphate pyrophosphatase [Gammaproteobacteria bacterium]